MAEGDDSRTVRDIFRKAATTTYHSHLLETEDFLVLLASGDAATDIVAAISPGNVRLWISGIYWDEYDWGPGDTDELEQLEETISAVQRGDGIFYFRTRDNELEYTGGRIGSKSSDIPFRPELAVRRTFSPWSKRTE
ncbi:hypothetical protein [Streptomyces yaizuensis]|uniref:Uncharacterized protein n=1 Tax=Streptomyces yaizuensis TaxID=2989713 RepID=A0AA86IZ84_9ACTN|nr:hypothetical protein [Streptomyces sp. YSPA8]BDT39546.1 hypothetical protein SYYSPA8_37140 [Streptomyces sp. YSPA8]